MTDDDQVPEEQASPDASGAPSLPPPPVGAPPPVQPTLKAAPAGAPPAASEGPTLKAAPVGAPPVDMSELPPAPEEQDSGEPIKLQPSSGVTLKPASDKAPVLFSAGTITLKPAAPPPGPPRPLPANPLMPPQFPMAPGVVPPRPPPLLAPSVRPMPVPRPPPRLGELGGAQPAPKPAPTLADINLDEVEDDGSFNPLLDPANAPVQLAIAQAVERDPEGAAAWYMELMRVGPRVMVKKLVEGIVAEGPMAGRVGAKMNLEAHLAAKRAAGFPGVGSNKSARKESREETMARVARTLPQLPGEPNCHQYIKTGECTYGESCRFNHPPDRWSHGAPRDDLPPPPPSRPSEQIDMNRVSALRRGLQQSN